METQSGNQQIKIDNEGQKVIYQIRKAYQEGSLSVSANPSAEVQFMLNKPTVIDPKQYQPDPKDKAFLMEVMKKIDSEQVKLFTPSSLLNLPVYEKLPADLKAKADYDILILIHKIRQLKKLWDEGDRDSYQIMNMVNSLRLAKESLESQQGNIFLI